MKPANQRNGGGESGFRRVDVTSRPLVRRLLLGVTVITAASAAVESSIPNRLQVNADRNLSREAQVQESQNIQSTQTSVSQSTSGSGSSLRITRERISGGSIDDGDAVVGTFSFEGSFEKDRNTLTEKEERLQDFLLG